MKNGDFAFMVILHDAPMFEVAYESMPPFLHYLNSYDINANNLINSRYAFNDLNCWRIIDYQMILPSFVLQLFYRISSGSFSYCS